MSDMTVSIRFVDPMFRIRVKEPDGAISVYGGRTIDGAVAKLTQARLNLTAILAAKGEGPCPWESELLTLVGEHVSQFYS